MAENVAPDNLEKRVPRIAPSWIIISVMSFLFYAHRPNLVQAVEFGEAGRRKSGFTSWPAAEHDSLYLSAEAPCQFLHPFPEHKLRSIPAEVRDHLGSSDQASLYT
jgi:hypothetical protein